MDVNERERKLVSILKRIEYIEEELEDSLSNYYIPFPQKINGYVVNVSVFEIIQHLKQDYKKEVLDNFYDEVERILSQRE